MPQPQLLVKVLQVLNAKHIDCMLTGSLASSMQGEPRSTHDIDLVVELAENAVRSLVDAFPPPAYYLSFEEAADAVRRKTMFNLLETTTGDKIDLWLLTNDRYDQRRFRGRSRWKPLGLA